MKVLGRIISVLALFLLVLTGCQHTKKTTTNALKQVTSSKNVWYLYQSKGTHSVISLKFTADKTVIVKDIDEIGAPGGENRVNDNFANPKYTVNQKKQQIEIKTSNRHMLLKLRQSYKETLNKKKMAGYRVTFDSEKDWKLSRIKSDGSDNGGTAIETKKTKKKATKQPANISSRLMSFVKDPTTGAKSLTDTADAGNYIYRTLVGQNRAYGQLTLNADGTYENSVSVHAVQSKKATEDNPDVAYYEVTTGQISMLYGKYYLVPKNLLRITYYVHGQNTSKPLPQKIALYTGDNIGLSRARVEKLNGAYQFYSKDYTPWVSDTSISYVPLTKTSQSQLAMPNVYQSALQQYQVWEKNPVTSNADLMQVIAAISDNNRNRIGDIGVNFSGSYGITQKPTDYQGIAKDGTKQPTVNYVFAVSPSSNQSGSAVIATQSGNLLVFGSLNNQLYLLHQPDSDSATVTWMPVKNVALKAPQVRILLNP